MNPNMPLRFLFYISDLYSGMTKEENIYGRKALTIPGPCFVIFYNGAEPQPDRQILRLSALYAVKNEETGLELMAVMLNVNRDHNREMMEACKDLKDYAEYVDRVRRQSTEICKGLSSVRSCRPRYRRVHQGEDPAGVSGKESGGGEEDEYIRI